MPLTPLTVTVAIYIVPKVPPDSPVFGTTVKLAFPFTAMLFIDGVLNVKEPLLLPESAAVNTPVSWFPVLLTVTDWAAGAAA
jgi:hypothetical protein